MMSEGREHWSSRLGFILAAIGSAIGLGILWKFPYVVGKNGGGLFFAAYLFFLLVIGLPLFLGELLLGKLSQRSAVGAFGLLGGAESRWRGVGWLSVLSSFLIMSFYSVIAGWGMSYVLSSITGMYSARGGCGGGKDAFAVLSGSLPLSLFWHGAFTAVTMSIVFFGVKRGIEQASRFMVKALLLLLVVLVGYGCTLPGFKEACHFVFFPNWETFTPSSALEALGLAFFTLSLSQGVMISYGSYLRPQENIIGMALTVVSSVIVVAVLAALVVFPVVFTFGVSPSSGEGLIFTTLPLLFMQMPGGALFSALFFLLFVFTALTSAIPLMEVVIANLMELYGIERQKGVLFVAAATFIVGIPSSDVGNKIIFKGWELLYTRGFLETVDNLVSVWLIPIGGLCTSLFIGWSLDRVELLKEFTHKRFGTAWLFSIRYIVPGAILLILAEKSGVIDIDMFMHSGGSS